MQAALLHQEIGIALFGLPRQPDQRLPGKVGQMQGCVLRQRMRRMRGQHIAFLVNQPFGQPGRADAPFEGKGNIKPVFAQGLNQFGRQSALVGQFRRIAGG